MIHWVVLYGLGFLLSPLFKYLLSMKIKPSALKNKMYLITLKKDYAVIDRCEPPLLKVYYYPKQKWGELLSVYVYTPDNFLEIQITAAVQKAIGFAMENII